MRFQESFLLENLMKNFKLNGYQKVSPPLIEYEKNFKYFLDTTKDENIFRLVDPISNQPMFIRNDITPQIARIAAGYGLDFKPESKGLKKFFYNCG